MNFFARVTKETNSSYLKETLKNQWKPKIQAFHKDFTWILAGRVDNEEVCRKCSLYFNYKNWKM